MQNTPEQQLISALVQAERAVRDAQYALEDAVYAARAADQPLTWQQIGRVLGISRQSAHERFRHPQCERV